MSNEDFWQNPESLLLLNPKLPADLQEHLQKSVEAQTQRGVVWLKSSGTESSGQGHKLVALRKTAILTAAASVNRFFSVQQNDVWLNPLPNFHIGGLAINARCFLSGAKEVCLQNWNVDDFLEALKKDKVSLTSLVPTQVYDLVENERTCPPSLRMILVGGGSLKTELYFQARRLGWPVLPSYGMTETAAVVAAAPLASLKDQEYPKMQVLPHVQLTRRGDQYLIQSPSLFSGFLMVEDKGGWQWLPRPESFCLDDRLIVENGFLEVLGRQSEIVKILGETVNLMQLKDRLQIKTPQNILILPVSEPRRGYDLHLVIEGPEFPATLEEVNQGLMPFERMAQIHFLSQFPRTELGKINQGEIRKQLHLEPLEKSN